MSYPTLIDAALRAVSRVKGTRLMYRRDGVGEVELTGARWGATRTETVGQDNVVIRGQVRDLIVSAAELVLPGLAHVTPAAGNVVLEQRDNQTFMYEVRPVGGDREWRWHDRHHRWFRIHVQHLATE